MSTGAAAFNLAFQHAYTVSSDMDDVVEDIGWSTKMDAKLRAQATSATTASRCCPFELVSRSFQGVRNMLLYLLAKDDITHHHDICDLLK